MEGIIKKHINELLSFNFIIPEYQRGYKWTKDEVDALLDDLYECQTEYCLQPLVVKEISKNEYEVVDGQQRLTTIYLFLKFYNQIDSFNIVYKSRENSEYFIKSINEIEKVNEENIDYYFLSNAYLEIGNWINNKVNKLNNIEGKTIHNSVNIKNKLFNTITEKTFFIWKELTKEIVCEEIFNKVNEGHIKLSNAELIKALMLNEKNFDEEKIDKKLEISLWWDDVERNLQNDSMWYFINSNDVDANKRIDLLFDTLATEYEIKGEVYNDNDYYKTFITYYKNYNLSNNKFEFVMNLKKRIDDLYENIKFWYEDIELYHLVGFLVSVKYTLFDLIKWSSQKNKNEIKRIFKNKIVERYKIEEIDLDAIEYKDSNCKDILLLHNIATLICKSEKQYKFPFHIYKIDKWDKEHIHATADDTDEPDDSIMNMALLNREINISYKDRPFGDKRDYILREVRIGKFVPLCTQNIFMKQYTPSKEIKDFSKWEDIDKKSYLNDIKTTFNDFINLYKE